MQTKLKLFLRLDEKNADRDQSETVRIETVQCATFESRISIHHQAFVTFCQKSHLTLLTRGQKRKRNKQTFQQQKIIKKILWFHYPYFQTNLISVTKYRVMTLLLNVFSIFQMTVVIIHHLSDSNIYDHGSAYRLLRQSNMPAITCPFPGRGYTTEDLNTVMVAALINALFKIEIPVCKERNLYLKCRYLYLKRRYLHCKTDICSELV